MGDWFYDPYSNKIKTKVGDNMYVDTEGNYEVNAGENLTWDPDDGQIHRIADPDNFDSNDDNDF